MVDYVQFAVLFVFILISHAVGWFSRSLLLLRIRGLESRVARLQTPDELTLDDQIEEVNKMEGTTDTPAPGSDAAVRQGCRCPVMDNCRGKGYMGQAGEYVISESCPIHWVPRAVEKVDEPNTGK